MAWEDFRTQWGADFGFFIAEKYDAECKENGKLNRQFSTPENSFGSITPLKVKHLTTLVSLHYQHGVTLTELRFLFENARTVPEVDEWLLGLERRLADTGEIPLSTLLHCLEDLKEDSKAKPNLAVVRVMREEFKRFSPERLTARLKALESIIGSRWIEVDEESYEVAMHQDVQEILREFDRNTTDLNDRFEFDPLWDFQVSITPIHPFPARMAPNIARESLGSVTKGARVLDPMCGSGTVLRAAVEAGLDCTGVDLDPLAVLMSRVWTAPPPASTLAHKAEHLVRRAQALQKDEIEQVSDTDTNRFIEFWFAPSQRQQLLWLATILREQEEAETAALAISFSRIIISKEMKASLARDTSHSRPHRVALENDFDVYQGFLKSASDVAKRLAPELIVGKAEIFEGDARLLTDLEDNTFRSRCYFSSLPECNRLPQGTQANSRLARL